eukprot:1126870_1
MVFQSNFFVFHPLFHSHLFIHIILLKNNFLMQHGSEHTGDVFASVLCFRYTQGQFRSCFWIICSVIAMVNIISNKPQSCTHVLSSFPIVAILCIVTLFY